ncbi:glycosyltransferase [Bacillus sp. Marseille-Q1617]|uniref:glycosyltransferase n=1 Tax=Bacillus sp. Marseille-Q1617 TaxID=2736887 RepID=UPI00158AC2F7|nr:glycosyltransferase [Bacillus sp. Marseille-Q1617]
MENKITIILATYNAEQYLNDCLNSISSQSYKNFNVNIIDDHSNDNTVKIIKDWCEIDPRFNLIDIHSQNKGLTYTLNELLESSDSEIIARMDADDLMMVNRLEKQYKFLIENPEISVVGSWAIEIDEDNHLGKIRKVPMSNKSINKVIPFVNPIIHPSVMFRKNDIVKIGSYNEKYRFAQDYELWFKCVENKLKLFNINEPLIKYRVSSKHVEKRKISYRLIDFKIRWQGTKKLKIIFPVRVFSSIIPILLGIIPNNIKRIALKYSHKIDPRYLKE